VGERVRRALGQCIGQPERIERTLRLLFFLNHWAKARERLLYTDRQGLYRVKAALVRQTFAAIVAMNCLICTDVCAH